MTALLPTNLIILGTIDSLFDVMKIQTERLETRDALLSTIMSRFFSALLEDSAFAEYIRDVAPRLQGNTDVEAVVRATTEHLAEKGQLALDVVPIFKAQAKAVLTDFVQAAEIDVPREDLLAFVDASFQS